MFKKIYKVQVTIKPFTNKSRFNILSLLNMLLSANLVLIY
jgi:hypothetical protein